MLNLQTQKFHPPALHDKVIDRPSLIKKTEAAARKSILFIHAPAGYGKTTLALLWGGFLKQKQAWLSLDKTDGDIKTFYTNFYGALSVYCNDSSPVNELIHNPCFETSPAECALKLLSRLKLSKDPMSIIIDNFKPSEHGTVTSNLPVLMKHLPLETKLIIISRTPPPEKLYDQIIKQSISIIDQDDLRFTSQEIKALFEKYGMSLSGFSLNELEELTGGWVSLLMSVIVSANGFYPLTSAKSFPVQEQIFNRYLISQAGDFRNSPEKDILLKTALCDFIEPDFCNMITGRNDCLGILLRLYEDTGFLYPYENGTYKYHPIFKNLLLEEFSADKTIQKEQLFKSAALWFLNNKKSLSSLDMAIKSKNIELTEEILLNICNLHKFNIGVEELTEVIEASLLKHIPVETIKKTPILALKCAWRCFIETNIKEMDTWLAEIKEMLRQGTMKQPIEIGTSILMLSLRCSGVWEIPKLLEYIPAKPLHTATAAVSLTHNLPFFHKAQHDYSEISLCTDIFLEKARPLLAPLLGNLYPILEQLLIAGLFYERNELTGASEIMAALQPIMTGATTELLFCFHILNSEILFLQNKDKFAFQNLQKIDKIIIDNNSHHLLTNLYAYKTKLSLYRGDTGAAFEWLNNYSADTDAGLKFHQSFQNLVTARALIVTGEIHTAIRFLNRLLIFSKDYHRTIDTVEILTLRAICYWHINKKNDAVADMENAVIIASKSELINPILTEGHDILPILLFSTNRVRLNLCSDELDKGFLMRLYLRSAEIAKVSKGLFYNIKQKPVKLSKKQLQALKLLSENLTYDQIAVATGVKITTVRDHISKLYDKLGVNNSTDALVKGRELNLL